ncbi:hypothetical protein LB516_06200 [Mesorhizobium sp. CO1-1-7]|uniref:hypothetical protein n=1 Tax=unclassified Mesorhizobium TaxID=325217 RepID=UPI0011282DC0|nr:MULTISPECIES: hypothetical protein [unclassified Mesorhizobium]MBZ9694805.1 hypothetical protein [Mesorhizobium sp. CO1-1-9]MBZ9727438.1 hypothetical protein [Mesorhizobium sp. CO1-1-11]MBZ9744833.1 hypothetical protein [Mesorhizobium sp. CO1-1-7]TPJ09030.1 hypothetical protein FJW04_27155 [Mesorhizobium sp. B2-7-3]TPK07435.1 hypothetical protein FJ543_28150 [Mesorhizobium sp. B2-5-7]
MPTISKLFESHAEAARIAGDLLAAGVPRVQVAIIGPYRDEIDVLRSPGVMLGAAAGLLACLGAVAVYDINLFPTGLSAIALASVFCGGLGGLLEAIVAAARRPERPSIGGGIVLVTAHVDDNATDIAQMMLGGCDSMTELAAQAA